MEKVKTKTPPVPSHLVSLRGLSQLIGRKYQYLYALQSRHKLFNPVSVPGRAFQYYDIAKSLKRYKKFSSGRSSGYTIPAAVQKATAA